MRSAFVCNGYHRECVSSGQYGVDRTDLCDENGRVCSREVDGLKGDLSSQVKEGLCEEREGGRKDVDFIGTSITAVGNPKDHRYRRRRQLSKEHFGRSLLVGSLWLVCSICSSGVPEGNVRRYPGRQHSCCASSTRPLSPWAASPPCEERLQL